MLLTKYITLDEFKEYSGIDLDAEMRLDANPSNTALAFLKRIEDRMATLIDEACFRKVDLEFPSFTDYQKEHYKLALIEQAIYVYRNGDISVDSGYDPEKGIVADKGKLQSLILAPNAKRNLQLCGLWCKKIRQSDWSHNLLSWWW